METSTNSSGNRFVNLLLMIFKVFYYLFSFTIVSIAIFLVGSMWGQSFDIKTSGVMLYFSLPEMVGQVLWSDAQASDFVIDQAIGTLSIDKVPVDVKRVHFFMTMITSTFILLSIRLTIAILKSVKNQAFLLVENAIRLRWIALLTIAIFLSDKLNTVLTSTFLAGKLQLESVQFTGSNWLVLNHFETIFMSLFLLVIAEVFRVAHT